MAADAGDVPAGAPVAARPRAFSAHAIHLVRTATQANLTLSQMADQKASLLMGAFALRDSRRVGGLAGAIRLVTKNPADATGLDDRGEIAVGKRADLVRVGFSGDQAVVRGVWREGARVS